MIWINPCQTSPGLTCDALQIQDNNKQKVSHYANGAIE
jgi:hypothetical protein